MMCTMPTTLHRDVIHKLVLQDPERETFVVPLESTLVSVARDSASNYPAVWYRRPAPVDIYQPTKVWTLGFVGTGEAFHYAATVLGTVHIRPFVFHVLDLGGTVAR